MISASLAGTFGGTATAAPGIGVNGQGKLLVVGDSLTVGTDAFGSLALKLRALGTWTSVAVDARVGRTANAGSVVLTKGITKSTTAIVIALGTNDMISKIHPSYPRWVIDRVMMQSRDRPVLWVNLEFSEKTRPDLVVRAKRFNSELRRAALRWPNLTISDWNTGFTPNTTSRFIADGIHLTVQGYRTRSRFMIPDISSFGLFIVNASTTTTTTTTTSTTTTTTTTTTPASTTSSPTTPVTEPPETSPTSTALIVPTTSAPTP